jgi:hypothetical protein
MATIYKTFLNNDVVSTRTLLHEAIPITGTIISGTYSDNNIKNYAHGMFQSVYDYPYLSSSANHIFDITVGISPNSSLSSSANQQNSKKINLYNQMAQVLVGNDITGSILEFDQDGNLTNGTKLREVFFMNTILSNKNQSIEGTILNDHRIWVPEWKRIVTCKNTSEIGSKCILRYSLDMNQTTWKRKMVFRCEDTNYHA